MKTVVEVAYKKLGEDGYYAFIEVYPEGKIHEFFSESWKILCDRVLFFCVDLVEED